MTEPNKESGIATTDMTVVLKLAKNRNKIMITNNAPSYNALPTLKTDASIKSA